MQWKLPFPFSRTYRLVALWAGHVGRSRVAQKTRTVAEGAGAGVVVQALEAEALELGPQLLTHQGCQLKEHIDIRTHKQGKSLTGRHIG